MVSECGRSVWIATFAANFSPSPAVNKTGPRASGDFQSANLAAYVEDPGDHFIGRPTTNVDEASRRRLDRAG